MVYTAFAMGARYLGGAYASPSGVFLPDLAANLQPAFGDIGAAGVFSPNALILVCMLSNAFMVRSINIHQNLYHIKIISFQCANIGTLQRTKVLQ